VSDVTFSELATAAYCPRKLYYRRRADDWEPPPETASIREIAFQYDRLLGSTDALADVPITVDPGSWRSNLRRARASLDAWPALVDFADRDRYLEGRDCRGVAQKLLADPPGVSLVSTGSPPPQGAWKPQRVRAVAAAKALAWERQAPVEHAFIEYPAHGIIRRVPLDGRRRAEYRRTLRTVRTLSGVPPRLRDTSKCAACEYRETCGVETRTLRSLLG
jgi:CRISPR-associated exonuclease Cas4